MATRRLVGRSNRTATEYTVHGLDVWGNAKDGYQVNDVYPSQGRVIIFDDASDAEIVSAMKKEGFIDKRVRTKSVRIDGEPGYDLYLEESRSHKPVYELRAIK